MKIIIHFIDGKSIDFNEKETNALLKKLNYLQLLNLFVKSPNNKDFTLIINGTKINTKDINSLELIFK